MVVKQISVFLENNTGKLNELSALFTDNNINLRALSLAETEGFGIVRVIVDDVYNASTILKEAGYVSSISDVVAIELSDEPGSLNAALDVLGKNEVNIEYMYAFTTHKPGTASMIMRVADATKVCEILAAEGFKTISQDELNK